MKRTDVRDSLADGIELAGPPAAAPNGMPILPTYRDPAPPHPRLCEYGPCVNYHRFVTQVDAQQPASGPAAVHFETHHYCYPTSGVETVLADMPVTECNRWKPILETTVRGGWRNIFAAAVDEWKHARAAELEGDAAEAADAESQISAAIAAQPTTESTK